MSEEKKFEFDNSWFELWTTQSKMFFESANKNLKDLFEKNAAIDPTKHMRQIQQWMDTLKTQWQFIELNEQQKVYANYWKQMEKMCNDASEMMLQEWIKRSKEQDPIKNVRELYELWLNCCHEVYKKAMYSKSYQAAYGDMMNAAIKYWQSVMPK